MNLIELENRRLAREIALLQRCQKKFKLPAKPIIDQLVVDANRPLPDVLPARPEMVKFEWPWSSEVDWRSYWQASDYYRRSRE